MQDEWERLQSAGQAATLATAILIWERDYD